MIWAACGSADDAPATASSATHKVRGDGKLLSGTTWNYTAADKAEGWCGHLRVRYDLKKYDARVPAEAEDCHKIVDKTNGSIMITCASAEMFILGRTPGPAKVVVQSAAGERAVMGKLRGRTSSTKGRFFLAMLHEPAYPVRVTVSQPGNPAVRQSQIDQDNCADFKGQIAVKYRSLGPF